MQAIFERQKQRGGDGEGPYILARTVRSCMQYSAAVDIGCRGGGNESQRAACFRRATRMVSGDGMETAPKEVVLALLRH